MPVGLAPQHSRSTWPMPEIDPELAAEQAEQRAAACAKELPLPERSRCEAKVGIGPAMAHVAGPHRTAPDRLLKLSSVPMPRPSKPLLEMAPRAIVMDSIERCQ
jgi:hypothetical protein